MYNYGRGVPDDCETIAIHTAKRAAKLQKQRLEKQYMAIVILKTIFIGTLQFAEPYF